MDDTNPSTGIRYGTIYGQDARELMETIFENGTDVSYENWKSEKFAEISFLLSGKRNVQDDVDALAEFIKENSNESDPQAEAASLLVAQDDEKVSDADVERVFDCLNLGESYDNDEPNYSYTDSDGNVFQMSYLGGAPLIWCIETDNVVQVRSLCSPCVPNAGDLNSGKKKDGWTCYGVPTRYSKKRAKKA